MKQHKSDRKNATAAIRILLNTIVSHAVFTSMNKISSNFFTVINAAFVRLEERKIMFTAINAEHVFEKNL